MGIFSRLTDIVNSNISAMLDRAEDPEKMIRLVIQEMEDTLVEVRADAARTIADQKDVDRKLKRMAAAQADWQKKAELALSKDREDLARGALAEKNRIAQSHAELEAERDHLKDALAKHEDDIIKLEQKLREARAKKATIDARHKTAANSLKVKKSLKDHRVTDAFERFEKMEQRLDRMEGEVEAMDLGGGEDMHDTFATWERDEALEAELAELKRKVGKTEA
ncbi:MAG: phage shock protein PspA [Rhodothalassiaceae bacterium]